MYIFGEKGTHDYPSLMVSREGDNVPISVSYGPIEIALRLNYEDLSRILQRIQPVAGPMTTRQVGTNSAYIAFGLRNDGTLLMRPTLVSDARGILSFNLGLPNDARAQFYSWLSIPDPANE